MSKKNKSAQRIAELEVKGRSGLIRMVAAIAGFAALIAVKVNLTTAGFEWANSQAVNAAFFILALVFAGVAGYGSRAWYRARNEIRALQQGRR